ncbi:hypothetical protein EIN_183240 [Entamoeba invadens IP1]|uniref:hypothetical protein n=1 Tax=Entamoeba invadens IP1 TaxID=370355 RepID=UPI0002C3E9C2|nr:hypothetical protein EIN_183240 [Entamoeba invadens IP1]ELP94057.1 hypothetical protein EIN_183240 [Entamoeba invadens IP1]|eukprot:XP_004260828.1 hypothetical protein EIN_183240 [Entamoeba invadens IP1]
MSEYQQPIPDVQKDIKQAENVKEHPIRFNKYEQKSPDYEKYYTLQNIVPPEELSLFIETIKKPLPTSFRLTRSSETFPKVKESIEEIIQSIPDELKPETFTWNPYTYQLNVERKQVRKCAQYEKLHKFMVLMNEAGEISRQEIVSMIPALLLDVHEGMSVLDICAAPGSKTSQLVEMTGKNGCVVANDADRQRSYLLTHQTKRLSMPHVVITNYKAQDLCFEDYKFDRMLCDVPCSGDGTIRKNVDARTCFHLMNAYVMHREQIDIMKNVICHLKVGGKFVYSTCSLNPIEDEAVVSEILRTYGDAVELIDARNTLPGLKYKQGISTWKVFDKNYTEVTGKTDNIPITALPPSEDEAKKFHLEYTLRILPHLQNTGGFYTAVFVKKGETPKIEKKRKCGAKMEQQVEEKFERNKEEVDRCLTGEKVEIKEKKPTKRRRGMAPIDDQEFKPLCSMPKGDEIFKQLIEFYKMRADFPQEQMYVIGDDCLSVHYVSSEVVKATHGLKIVCGGVKMFKKHKSELVEAYRMVSDGVRIISEFVGSERTIELTHQEFLNILQDDIKLDSLRQKVEGNGCYVMKVVDGILQGSYFSGWVGKVFLSCLIPKQDMEALQFLFGVTDKRKKLVKKGAKDESEAQKDKKVE